MKKYFFVLICVLVAGFSGCKKDADTFDPNPQEDIDDAVIKAYIQKNNLTYIQDPSNLYYQVVTQGNGVNYPTTSSNVTVAYTGTLLDGTQFDASNSFTTSLTSVISGWAIGLQHIKPGGRIKLIIPSVLGYKNTATGSIPANSVLMFTIDLISIN